LAIPLRVLIIEDSADDASLMDTRLQEAGYAPSVLRVATSADLRTALAAGPWDLVLADHNVPGMNVADTLRAVKATDYDGPYLIVSGIASLEEAIPLLKNGAHDFISKANLARLGPAVKRELEAAQEHAAKRATEKALAERNHQLEVILNISHILADVGPSAVRVSKSLRILRDLAQADEALLRVPDETQLALKLWAHSCDGLEPIRDVIPVEAETPAVRAFKLGRTVVSNYFRREFPVAASTIAPTAEAVLSVPLVQTGQTFGALVLVSRRKGHFSNPIVSLVEGIAGHITPYLYQAKLHFELEQRHHELAALNAMFQQHLNQRFAAVEANVELLKAIEQIGHIVATIHGGKRPSSFEPRISPVDGPTPPPATGAAPPPDSAPEA